MQLLIKESRGSQAAILSPGLGLRCQHACGQETLGGSLDLGAAASMAGEEAGRRGVPSLLNPPSASSEGQQEHIASDVTQVRLLAPSRSLAVPALPCLPACLLGHHEPATRD